MLLFPCLTGICSSGDRAAVSGTAWRGFESLQMRLKILAFELKCRREELSGQLLEVLEMLDDFREWLSDNLRYILLGVAIVLVAVIIICAVRLIGGSSKKNDQSAKQEQAVVGENQENVTEAAASGSELELTKDDTAVLTLMKEYYTAIAANDTAALSSLVDPWDDLSKEHIRFSDDIESYNDISTYSAAGINDGEYVVFNSYYSKIKGIDTLVPTMVVVYVRTAQDGTLKIYSYEDRDTAVADYVTKVSSQENVRELISKVNNEYQQAIASDSALASYLNGEKTTESGDAGTAAAGSSMVSKADLNIRQEPGTDANVIGVVPSGETVEVVAQADDGWVQINYVTQAGTVTGYVKSEYLTSASGSTVAETSSTSGTAAGSGTGTQDTAANGTGTSSQGSVQLTSEGDGSSTAA